MAPVRMHCTLLTGSACWPIEPEHPVVACQCLVVSGGCRQLLLFLYAEGLVREGVVSSPTSASTIALMSSVNTMALSAGQVMTFRETLLWPNRIKSDMDAAEKTLNGEKLKLIEELDWRCERFVKNLADLTSAAQKVGVARMHNASLLPTCITVLSVHLSLVANALPLSVTRTRTDWAGG